MGHLGSLSTVVLLVLNISVQRGDTCLQHGPTCGEQIMAGTPSPCLSTSKLSHSCPQDIQSAFVYPCYEFSAYRLSKCCLWVKHSCALPSSFQVLEQQGPFESLWFCWKAGQKVFEMCCGLFVEFMPSSLSAVLGMLTTPWTPHLKHATTLWPAYTCRQVFEIGAVHITPKPWEP